jgi:hypothetical protein
MNKDELIKPLLFLFLSFVFVIICLMVYVTRGKSKIWINHKIKTGAILLSLSAITSGTGCVTCYDMPEPIMVTFNGSSSYIIEMKPVSGHVLQGTLYMPGNKDFSFKLNDLGNQLIQTGELVPADGEFGDQKEDFSLEIDKNIGLGEYHLDLYNMGIDYQDESAPFKTFLLKVTK